MGRISGFDHVSVPMQDPDAMVAFYRELGFPVAETPHLVSVYAGSQMINFHRPSVWTRVASYNTCRQHL
jgi:catechol 2,3-dioxygenase-like lactoylglutathione lyase family enzyme